MLSVYREREPLPKDETFSHIVLKSELVFPSLCKILSKKTFSEPTTSSHTPLKQLQIVMRSLKSLKNIHLFGKIYSFVFHI